MSSRFENFLSLIIEINRDIQRIKDAEMGKFGLKASHTMCLYYLSQHPEGLTATKLTELCIIDSAINDAMSRVGLDMSAENREFLYTSLEEIRDNLSKYLESEKK